MTAPTSWWWIRHAPIPGPPGRLHGQRDVSCTTTDRDSFQALSKMLPGNAVWVTSGLVRTRETMSAIAAAGLDLPEPVVERDFMEQNFGRWQGLAWSEMEARDPDIYTAFWRNPVRTAPPDGESFVALMERTRIAMERLTNDYAGGTIVCVSHGGTIRAACAAALGLTPEAAMAVVVDNLSITRMSYVADRLLRGSGGVWSVQGINCPCRWIP